MAKQFLDLTGLNKVWEQVNKLFQRKLVSGTNIKTINNQSLLGKGNINTPNTTYKQATTDTLGLVKIGATGLESKQYAVQLNSNGEMFVYVPWIDGLSKSLIVIEQNIPIVNSAVMNQCMMKPTGTVTLVGNNGRYELGILSGIVFNNFLCGNIQNNLIINKLTDGMVLKKRILISNDRYFVPLEEASAFYTECSSLDEAFEKLYVNYDDAITTDELNEVLV